MNKLPISKTKAVDFGLGFISWYFLETVLFLSTAKIFEDAYNFLTKESFPSFISIIALSWIITISLAVVARVKRKTWVFYGVVAAVFLNVAGWIIELSVLSDGPLTALVDFMFYPLPLFVMLY